MIGGIVTLNVWIHVSCFVVSAAILSGCGDDVQNPVAQQDAEARNGVSVGPSRAPQAAQTLVLRPGDINPDVDGDGAVTIADLGVIAAAFGRQGHDLIADVNRNGTVDIADLVTAASAFGEDVEMAPPEFGALLNTLDRRGSESSVAFAPGGGLLAFGVIGKPAYQVRLWDVVAGHDVQPIEGFVGRTFAVAFSPDGETLAVVGEQWPVKLWDIASGQEIGRLEGHQDQGYSVAFSPDGTMVASGSRDARTRLWDVGARALIATYLHSTTVVSVAFSPDGGTLASSSRAVVLWDIAEQRETARLTDGLEGLVYSVAYSPDGRLLAASAFGGVTLWETDDLGRFTALDAATRGVLSVAFSPDGSMLAAGDRDRNVTIWDVQTSAPLKTLRAHSDDVTSVAFSPDGAILASATAYEVKLWSVTR